MNENVSFLILKESKDKDRTYEVANTRIYWMFLRPKKEVLRVEFDTKDDTVVKDLIDYGRSKKAITLIVYNPSENKPISFNGTVDMIIYTSNGITAVEMKSIEVENEIEEYEKDQSTLLQLFSSLIDTQKNMIERSEFISEAERLGYNADYINKVLDKLIHDGKIITIETKLCLPISNGA